MPLRAILAVFLALAVLASPAPAQNEAAETVEIVLADFSFTPETLRLRAGRPVTLRFVNRGSGGHNFKARDFFNAAAYPDGQSAPDRGTVELDEGESASVTLVPAAGEYSLHCSHFMHTTFGMRGAIVVE